MPIIQQSFKVDLFTMRYARDPAQLLDSIKAGHARDLGLALIQDFPYEMKERYEGELPSAVLTKDHIFTETWMVRFMALDKRRVEMLIDLRFELERAGQDKFAAQLKYILED